MIRPGICNELFEGWELGPVCRTVLALGSDDLEIAPSARADRISALPALCRCEWRAMIGGAGPRAGLAAAGAAR